MDGPGAPAAAAAAAGALPLGFGWDALLIACGAGAQWLVGRWVDLRRERRESRRDDREAVAQALEALEKTVLTLRGEVERLADAKAAGEKEGSELRRRTHALEEEAAECRRDRRVLRDQIHETRGELQVALARLAAEET